MSENPYLEPPLPNYETNGGFDWDDVEEMADEDLKQQYDHFREAVEHHSRLYYVEFAPVIADGVYDEMFHRLEDLEDWLEIYDEDSPTNTVGTDRANSDTTLYE